MRALNTVLIGAVLILTAASYLALREVRVMVGINRCMIEVSDVEEAFSICAQGTALEEGG